MQQTEEFVPEAYVSQLAFNGANARVFASLELQVEDEETTRTGITVYGTTIESYKCAVGYYCRSFLHREYWRRRSGVFR